MNGIFTSRTQLLHSIDWIVKSGHTPEWKQVVVSEVKQVINALMHINALGIKVSK